MDVETKDVLRLLVSILRTQTEQIDFLHKWVKELLDTYSPSEAEAYKHSQPPPIVGTQVLNNAAQLHSIDEIIRRLKD